LSKIIRPEDVKEQMTIDLLNGLEKGTTTYIEEFDDAWKWRNGEVNLWSGYANEGKGTFTRFLCLIKALEEKKKFAFYAPEDGPAEWFFSELISTLSGKSTDKNNPNFIGADLYDKCFEIIKELFIYVQIKSPKNTIENIVKSWEELVKEEPIYGFVIDPFVRMTRSKEAPDRDDLYASYVMSILSDFAIDYPICSMHMVLHQQTPKRNEAGYYPEPNMYAVKGGGNFADVSDNVLSAWRPKYAKEKLDTEVIITSQKIKKQKLVGIPQSLKLRFDRKTNRFIDYNTSTDIYNFDKWTNPTQKSKLRF
jgi:twinkle protein